MMTTRVHAASSGSTVKAESAKETSKDSTEQPTDEFNGLLAAFYCASLPPQSQSTEATDSQEVAPKEVSSETSPLPLPLPFIRPRPIPMPFETVPPGVLPPVEVKPALTEPATSDAQLVLVPPPQDILPAPAPPAVASLSTGASQAPADQTPPMPTVQPATEASSLVTTVGVATSETNATDAAFAKLTKPNSNEIVLPVTKPNGETGNTTVNPTRGDGQTIIADAQAGVIASDVPSTFQTEAAQRAAHIVASYVAQAIHNDREATSVQSIKPLLSIREFSQHDGTTKEGSNSATTETADGTLLVNQSFTPAGQPTGPFATLNSAAAQAANRILTLADSVAPRQTRSLRLRLQPEELGRIEIQLTRDAQGRLSAHLTAERETARLAISQTLGQLRETLERAGLSVDQLRINSESGLAGNERNAERQSQPQKPRSSQGQLFETTETESDGTSRAYDYKLVNLSA